jgi:group II intron reverse transcriptase/maturase
MMNVMQTKSVPVTMKMVVDAYRRVRSNKGGAGVDGITLEKYEADITNQLYKVWNRLTSGSYFPPEVRLTQIPKGNGKLRDLGIPTIGDRVAQQVIKTYLEPRYEAKFSQSSYGYRPHKSAHQAIGECQKNCWKYDWVIDLDIKGFFDNINHEWMMRMLEQETKETWVLMYIKRWLEAPMRRQNGEVETRTKGTPQGGVISPLLANIYLHYALDLWIEKKHQDTKFERYADDVVIHCQSRKEAEEMLEAVRERLGKFGLELSEEKTKIVYCKHGKQPDRKEELQKFTFLGHDFKPKSAKNRQNGKKFLSYMAVMSIAAKGKIHQMQKEWNIHRRTDLSLEAISTMINSKVQGWINYFEAYGRNELWHILSGLNHRLIKWWKRKHKLESIYIAIEQIKAKQQINFQLFAHWKAAYRM